MVGNGVIKCENCGCDDESLIEINHINGGGTKEIRSGYSYVFAIIKGRRKVDDLNLLCKLCNTLHYIDMKYGREKYEAIVWRGESCQR